MGKRFGLEQQQVPRTVAAKRAEADSNDPGRRVARVEGRSSLARLGVGIHVTAPTIHADFGATDDPDYPGTRIRLEVWNCGELHVCLQPGMKVCQQQFPLSLCENPSGRFGACFWRVMWVS
jgi:hypothetical protein